jgi:hypothetical protein
VGSKGALLVTIVLAFPLGGVAGSLLAFLTPFALALPVAALGYAAFYAFSKGADPSQSGALPRRSRQ